MGMCVLWECLCVVGGTKPDTKVLNNQELAEVELVEPGIGAT